MAKIFARSPYIIEIDESSVVGEAFRRIGRRINGEPNVPELDFSEGNGIWGTMKRWMGFGVAQGVA